MSRISRRTRARAAPSGTSIHSQFPHEEEGAGHRQARLEHILLDELQTLIQDEATDPSLQDVKVLDVSLQAGGTARVAYAVVAALDREHTVEQRSREGLKRAMGFLRMRLAQQLNLKKLPKLTFTFVGVVGGDAPPPDEEGWPGGDA